jgi:hypothetical protein
MKSYLSRRAGCLYRQAASSWNVLDTLDDVIIGNHLSATRRFRHVPEPHGTSWNPAEPHGIPRNLMEGSRTWRNLLVADK